MYVLNERTIYDESDLLSHSESVYMFTMVSVQVPQLLKSVFEIVQSSLYVMGKKLQIDIYVIVAVYVYTCTIAYVNKTQ